MPINSIIPELFAYTAILFGGMLAFAIAGWIMDRAVARGGGKAKW